MPGAATGSEGCCTNCGARLASPRPNFCPACGQETHIQPPTIREFVQQFGGAYFSTEGALWRTLRLLLLQPGELTRQYLAGRRKHYVLPLRLYLTISVLTLLLMRTVGSGGLVSVDLHLDDAGKGLDGRNFVILAPSDDETRGIGVRNGVFYCNSVPEWVCHRLQRRIGLDPKALKSEIAALRDRYLSNLGGAMFVLLPSFALWLALVYRNRRMRYTEHLVFALHVHALWFLALALTLPQQPWLSGIVALAVPWYTLAAMRRVYGGRRWPRLLRAALVSVLYGLTMSLSLAGIAVWSVLT